MEFINLEQGSDEWKCFRMKHITATDCGTILGLSHFSTMSQLYDEKIGLLTPTPPNAKMLMGQKYEPEARQLFNQELQLDCEPVVVRSEEYPFLMASLDGISSDHKHIVEIKCSNFLFRNAQQNVIPESYKCQMQFQMAVTDLDHCFYFVYWNKAYVSIRVERDQDFIDEMIPKMYEFWQCLQNLEFPKGYNEDRFIRNDM